MSRPKTRQVGTAGLVTRYRNGVCAFACNHSDCHAYSEPRGWHAALRLARQHAAAHAATEARYVGTPWGIPAHELPPTTRRLSGPLGRLAIVVLVLTLTALVLTLTANVTGHAASAPGAPAIAVVPTTAPAPEGYVPTASGPPATDRNGQWLPEPDQAPAPAGPDAGGGR